MISQGIYRANIRSIVVFTLAVFLIGCGGSDESTPPASDDVVPTINVSPADIIPFPGLPVKVDVSQEAVLDGSGSTVLVDRPLEYIWAFSHRPDGSKAVLQNANTVAPSFVADVRGTYIVKLVAMVGGVSADPVYATVEALNEFSPPIPRPDHTTMVIKFDKPCVQCHIGGPGELIGKSPGHINSGELCQACHSIMGFTPVPYVDHDLVTGVCSGCHDGEVAIGKSNQHVATAGECNECHDTTSFLFLQPDGSYDHSEIADNCGRCHNGTLAIGQDDDHLTTINDCVLCHSTDAFKPATFDHTSFTFDCARSGCHTGPPNAIGQPVGHPDTNTPNIDCSVCHNIKTFIIGNVFDHSVVISSSLTCTACHDGDAAVAIVKPSTHLSTGTDCGMCHKTAGFIPAYVDHTSAAVTGTAGNPVRCDSCHNNTNVIGLPQPPAIHMPITAPEDCGDRCHTPGTFTSGVFDHKVSGVLIDANCASCHNDKITSGKPVTHIPTTEDCSVCHKTDKFVGIVFTHAGIDIKNCALCHNGIISIGQDKFHLPTTQDCSVCHGVDYTSFATGLFHKNVMVTDNCATCHNGVIATGNSTTTHIPTGDDCSVCHSVSAFLPSNFATDVHINITSGCVECHTGQYISANNIVRGKPLNHIASSDLCETCHSLTTFSTVSAVDHQQVIGVCSNCHNGVLAIGKSDQHLPTSGECNTCHTTDVFIPASFTHAEYKDNCARSGCHTGEPNAAIGQPAGHPETNAINIDCSHCHNTTAFSMNNVFDHALINAGQLTCAACHSGVGAVAIVKPSTHLSTSADCGMCHKTLGFKPAYVDHGSEAVTGTAANPVRCDSCHNNTNVIGLPQPPAAHMPISAPEDCGDRCHTPGSFSTGVFDHMENGLLIATNCATCHDAVIATGKSITHLPTTADCSVCHTTDKFVGIVFNHASIDVNNCALCHDGGVSIGKDLNHLPTTLDCSVCHGADYTTFTTGVFHANVQVTDGCSACHNGTITIGKSPTTHIPTLEECSVCHTVSAFRPSMFITDVHINITSACVNCHNGLHTTPNIVVPGKSPNHIPTSNLCEMCHTLTTFAVVNVVNHQQVFGVCSDCHNGIQAIGKSDRHVPTSGECNDCHTSTTSFFAVDLNGKYDHTNVLSDCSLCHNGTLAIGKDANHIDTVSECNACHTTTAFLPASFDHTNFTNDCARSGCHTGAPNAALGQPAGHPDTNAINVDCSLCHNTSAFFMGNVFNHSIISSGLLACAACHAGTGAVAKIKPLTHLSTSADCGLCHTTSIFKPAYVDHSSEAVTGTTGNPVRCDSCHNNIDVIGLPISPAPHIPVTPPEDCGDRCHTPGTFTSGVYNHIEAGILINTNCASCHNGTVSVGKLISHIPTNEDCSVCHSTDSFIGAVFTHVGIDVNNCALCHDGGIATGKMPNHLPTTDDCSVCHSANYVSFTNGVFHSNVNVADNCVSCHDGIITTGKPPVVHIPTLDDCHVCHNVGAFAPSKFLSAVHINIIQGCEGCHNGQFTTPNVTVAEKPLGHLPTNQDCNICHTTSAFIPSIFSHIGINSNCATCHNGNYVASGALAAPGTLIHSIANSAGTDCVACHKTTLFKPAFVNHNSSLVTSNTCMSCHDGVAATGKADKLDGPHVQTTQDCNICHVAGGNFKPAVFDHSNLPTNQRCDSCHGISATGKDAKTNPAHIPTAEDCAVCHNTVAFAGAKYNHVGITGNCALCHGDSVSGKPTYHVPTADDCSVCHVTTGFLPATFSHAGIVDNCSACHDDFFAIGKPSGHVATTQDCGVCHNTTTFIGAVFDHTGIIDNCARSGCHGDGAIGMDAKSNPSHIPTTLDCAVCHTTATFLGATWDHGTDSAGRCLDCHIASVGATPQPTAGHFDTGPTVQCDACHTTNSWVPANAFDHCPNTTNSTCASSNYPGDHNLTVGCISCHTNNSQVVIYDFSTYAPFCAGCHADDFRSKDKHIGGSNGTIEQNKNCGASGCHATKSNTFSK